MRTCSDYKVTINPALQADQYPFPKPTNLIHVPGWCPGAPSVPGWIQAVSPSLSILWHSHPGSSEVWVAPHHPSAGRNTVKAHMYMYVVSNS